jgi:hypothetical protein
MASGGGGSSSNSSKPVFLPGQKDMATEILMGILGPMAMGGAPDAGTQVANNRGRQGLNQQLAQQGLTGSGLAAKSAVGLEQGFAENAAKQRFDIINRIFSPLGQAGSGSSTNANIGFGS